MQYSAEFMWLDMALSERNKSFEILKMEMDSFCPLPIQAFEEERKKLQDHFVKCNPNRDLNDLIGATNEQITFRFSPSMQFHEKFGNRFAVEIINIVLLSHALCEAYINAILALELAENKLQDLFFLLEKSNLKEKWTIAPKTFLTSYKLDKSEHLYEILGKLCKMRNSFVHSKIEIFDNSGKKLLAGTVDSRFSMDPKSVDLYQKFIQLPKDLVKNLVNQLNNPGQIFQINNLIINPYNFEA